MANTKTVLPSGVPEYLTVPEAAMMLHCRERHVWDMIYKRDIPATTLGKRLRRIPLAALVELLDEATVPALSKSG